MPDSAQFQTQNLFLLVGTNPLPNYVAARLLLKTGGQLYLVHTDETSQIADRLTAALDPGGNATKGAEGKQRGRAIKIPVDEAKSDDIFTKVSRCAEGKQDVGLNYTGGTKTMAVHAYRAVEQNCPDAVFSYLDAKTLSLFVEAKRPQGQQMQQISVARTLEISLSKMLALYAYNLPQVRQTPVQPEICQALARIHSNTSAFGQWRDWCGQQSLQNLPNRQQYPLLGDVIDAFDRLGNGNATPELIAQALNPEWTGLEQCRKWFLGDWLEEYTLWACIEARSQNPKLFSDFGIDLKPKGPKKRAFQFDVAIVRGYQLFAISCIASDKKEKCKEHLFEAYVRARQMGGDEARIGLVSCAPKDNPDSSPSAIQREIEEAWDAKGKVRVFGAEHLPDLPAYLKDWFDPQPQ